MGTPKPLGSLSSGLLARKGHARPAMRPQGFGSLVTLAPAHDDLGWNDMGEAEPAVPPVLAEREALREGIAAVEAPEIVEISRVRAERIRRETRAKGAKAAFTLRLDQDRHLRLRLASAVRNLSSQQLVTQAVDAFLDAIPEVDMLVHRLAGDTPSVKKASR